MIEMKLIEIRDSATCIPAMALHLSYDEETDPPSHWLLDRAGYGKEGCVLLIKLEEPSCQYEIYNWHPGSRTMRTAHVWIEENWATIKDGDVVDVRVILGEQAVPARLDRCLNSDEKWTKFMDGVILGKIHESKTRE